MLMYFDKNVTPFYFYILLAIAFLLPRTSAAQDQGEIDALLDLAMQYDTLQSLGWGVDTDYCNWNRVTCNEEGHVTFLNLQHLPLGSPLPESIGNLIYLNRLDIHLCELEVIPSSIQDLPNLTELTIRGNLLDEVPSFIFDMTQLKWLDISRLNLTDIPAEISKLHNLENLNISDNKLVVVIPELFSLSKLQILDMSINEIEIVPDLFDQLPELNSLRINKNKLSNFPPSFGLLSQLKFLDAKENQLETFIANTDYLVALETLFVQNNRLINLPNSIGNNSNLKILDASFNYIKSLPENLENLNKLVQLRVQTNAIRNVPPALAVLPELKTVAIQGNKLGFRELLPLKENNFQTFLYAPQDSLAYPDNEFYYMGDAVEIKTGTNHSDGNEYIWKRNNSILTNETNYLLAFDSITIDDFNNDYFCEIRNPDLPFLVLRRHKLKLYEKSLELTNMEVDSINCFGNAEGRILVKATSDEIISYNWGHTSEQVNELVNLTAGEYHLDIVDALGDSIYINFVLDEPDSISIDYVVEGTNPSNDNGAITLTINGGVAPYEIYLDEVLITNTNINNLAVGTYEIVVVDADGCTTSVEVEVPLLTSINSLKTEETITIYPNPSRAYINLDLIAADIQQIQIYNVLGVSVLEQDFIANESINISSLATGNYYLRGYDHKRNKNYIGTFTKQ